MILKRTLKILAACFLVYLIKDAIFNPTPLIDEGYYLGATHAVLRGDWLLHHYNFDKPFLLAFWPIPGIGIFGEIPLGFHFVALLCYLGSFFCLIDILEVISDHFLPALIFSLFVMKIPIVATHMVSNFCEPYLVFSLLMMTRAIVRERGRKEISIWFFIAFFTKYSALLWFPVVMADEWVKSGRKKSLREWIRWMKSFLRESKYLIAVGVAYSAFNGTPFASVLWFSGLAASDGVKVPFLTRIGTWGAHLYDVFVSHPLAILVLVLFGLGFIFAFLKRKHSPDFFIFFIPAILHFLAFPLSNAQFYDRYFVQFLPLLLICVFWMGARFFILGLAVSGVALFLVPAGQYLQSEQVLQDGRNLYVVREVLDHDSVYLNNGELWGLAAFHDHLYSSGCTSVQCVNHDRKGASVFTNHFVFNQHQIWKVPMVWPTDSHYVKTSVISLPFDQDAIGEDILKHLKLGKAVSLHSVEWSSEPHVSPEGYTDFFDKATLRLVGTTNRKYLNFETGTELIVEGKLALSHLPDDQFPAPKYRFIFRVDAIRVDHTNYVDEVMPMFFRSYTVALSPLPIEVSDHAEVTAFESDPTSGKAKYTITEVK